MTQTTLSDLAAPQTKLHAVNSCWNCHNKQDIRMIAGQQKVVCFGKLRDFQSGCPSWSDGNDLAAMLDCAPSAGWLPKKWAGGQE